MIMPVKPCTYRIGPSALLLALLAMTACQTHQAETPAVAAIQSSTQAATQLELYRPRFPNSGSSTVDVDAIGDSVTVSFLYKPMTLNDTVGMRWKGRSEWLAKTQVVKTPNVPLMFQIPRSEIAKDIGSTAVVTGSVGVGGNPLLISPPFNVRVTQTGTNPGSRIAANLNARYNARENTCPGNLPAYYCNGIIIRSVDDGPFNPWDPSPSAIKLGAVSFSYFRVDSVVSNFYRDAGFIFLPQAEAAAQGKGMEYLCIYAYDAATAVGVRSGKGCGLKPRSVAAADLSTCASVNVTTEATWYAYSSKLPDRNYQCSLSTQNAAQFAISYKVRSNPPPNIKAAWNELMVNLWPQNYGAQLPIEAFFYKVGNTASLNNAKSFQTKFKANTGIWVPVVALNLRQLTHSPFSYNKADQAVQP